MKSAGAMLANLSLSGIDKPARPTNLVATLLPVRGATGGAGGDGGSSSPERGAAARDRSVAPVTKRAAKLEWDFKGLNPAGRRTRPRGLHTTSA